MPAKKARQQDDHGPLQQQQPADEGYLHLEQLPLHALQQVADFCAEPNAPAALSWAPVCSSWRTAATTTLGPPLSIACGKHLSPALHVRSFRISRLGQVPAACHLPITPVLWSSHRDVTRVTSLGAWLRHNAASVPELAVQAVNAGRAQLALPVRVYRQLELDWADAHASLFAGLGAAAGGGSRGGEAAAAAAAAAAEAPAAGAGGDAPKGAPYLTHLQLPGLGHVPAPTLAAGLAACPALQSLSLPYTWPQWLGSRTSSHFGALYGALRGLTGLVKLELGVEGLQAGTWEDGAAAAAGPAATGDATETAAAAAAAGGVQAEGGADSDDEVPTLLRTIKRRGKVPDRVDLTPLFQGLPSSIQEVVLTGGSLCKCSLHPRSLQHLHNLRQLQLPEYVVFEGTDEDGCADLAALTALTELRGNDVLSDGSEALLLVPNLRRLVVSSSATAAAGPLVALVLQQQLRELEVVWSDAEVQCRYEGEIEGEEAAEAAWSGLMTALPRLQQVTSLILSFDSKMLRMPPDAEEPAAAVKQLVNLKVLTMPVECLLGALGPAVLPKGLTALTLTLGSGICVPDLLAEADPPLLLPALSVVSRAHVPALKSVDFRAWSGNTQPPSQEQYDELQQGSQALPPRVKVLWGGTPLAQVVPLPAPAPVVPDPLEAAAEEDEGQDEEEIAELLLAGLLEEDEDGEGEEGGGADGAAAGGDAEGAAAAGGGDVQMAEAGQGDAADA